MFRMALKPLNGVRAGWTSFEVVGADLFNRSGKQLVCNALSAQRRVYKGVIDDSKPVAGCGKGNFRQQLSGIIGEENMPGLFLKFHVYHLLSFSIRHPGDKHKEKHLWKLFRNSGTLHFLKNNAAAALVLA